jgi:hypothetical protein
MVQQRKRLKRNPSFECVNTMDFAELARIRAEKKMLEKAGKLPEQKRRTELECIWFFMNKVRCSSPSVLRKVL